MPRLTYVEGMLELRSPGTPHESDKKKLARIFEAYLEHLRIPAEGVGSWTVKNKKKLSAEADECYVLTTVPVGPSVKAPDLVAKAGRERSLVLAPRRAHGVRSSALVPALDLELVVRCMREKTQTAAVRALRAALAKQRS